MTNLNIKNQTIYDGAGTVKSNNKTNATEETEDTSLFNTEESKSNILEKALDSILGDGDFTKEEAETYVNGEAEIAELIKKEKEDKGILEVILESNSIEKQIRKEYEEKHPEYAKVKDEGDRVQKEYKEALTEANKKWIEENPSPKDSGIFSLEYLNWKLKQSNAMKDFQKNYANENPDYANLKLAQDMNKSLLELFLS